MPPMLYVLIFLAAFLLVEGLSMISAGRRSGTQTAARDRLRKIAIGIQDPDVQSEDSILRARKQAGKGWLDLVSLLPGGLQLERRLYQAGLTWTPTQFVVLSLCLGVGSWLMASIFLSRVDTTLPFVLVGFLPLWQVYRLRTKRMRQFEEQFPEALDLVTRAMRAGHSLTLGFQMVGEELPDPIGPEFGQVAEEVKLGQEYKVALSNLVYRVEAGDLPFFATAIMIQRETGGNLAEVLDKLGTLIRDRFALYGKVRALTAIGRASANLLACMPLVIVLMLYTCGGDGGRSYVEPLYTTVPGYMLSAAAAALVLIGYVVCLRMAKIEV